VKPYSAFTLPTLFCLMLSSQAIAESKTMFHLGPFIGSGQTSDDASVRYANGLRAQFDYNLTRQQRWTLDARLELQNSLINTSSKSNEDWRELAVRDYRLAALGLKASYLLPTNSETSSELYLSAVVGPSVAKLSLDRSDESNESFTQRQMRGLRGIYYGLETGSHYFLEENFAITLAATLGYYDVDQSRAHGSHSGEVRENGAIRLISEESTASDAELANNLTQTLYTISFGLSFRL